MEEKRILLAVALCLVLVIIYSYAFGPKARPPAPTQAPVPASQASNQNQVAAPGPASEVAKGTQGPASQLAAHPASAPAKAARAYVPGPERTVDVTLPGRADLRFSSRGGALVEDQLLEPRYTEKLGEKTVPIDLARVPKQALAPLRIGFEGSGLHYDPSVDYQVSKKGWEVDLVQPPAAGNDLAVTKKLVFDPQSYLFDMTVEVKNVSGHPVDESMVVYDDGWQNPANNSKSFFTRLTARITESMCYTGGKLETRDLGDLKKKGPWEKTGAVGWAGLDYRYFLLALVPHGGPMAQTCRARNPADGTVESQLVYASQHLAAGQTATYAIGVYAGPKFFHILKDISYPGLDPHLGEAVQFGIFGFIAQPLLYILRLFQRLVRNWGLAIILLTIFVKLITFYWTEKSMKAMREMQRLKPKLDEIKERYGKDKTRLNQEMMNLYKVHGVNPAAGCLPMLLQMPVWYALYEALENAVELYNAPFGGWIHDLAGPDPYYIIPVVMGVLMIVQQRMTPTTVDSDQQKLMMYMMPVMMTAFSLMLPSGLTIYIIVNSILTIIQQQWLNKRYPLGPVPAAAGKKKRSA